MSNPSSTLLSTPDQVFDFVVASDDYFDLDQFFNGLPTTIYKKASIFWTTDLAKIFLNMLMKDMTEEEKTKLTAYCRKNYTCGPIDPQ